MMMMSDLPSESSAAYGFNSDLPRDATEEVLSKLPVTSLRGVRCTCKKWNTLTKDEGFIKKHLRKAATKNHQVVMLLDDKVYLMSVDLVNPSIERIAKLVSLNNNDPGVNMSQIFHCDGLFLCITKSSQLVVWNPYTSQTRWIQPRDSYHKFDSYALGYDKMNRHKVLRFVNFFDGSMKRRVCESEVYSLSSNSWNVVDVKPDWTIGIYQCGLSLKGNTYWIAHDPRDFLLCFDFTNERFGPRLPLPFHSFDDIVALSSVGEDQLAVLFQKYGRPPYTVKIWISSKIEPNAVSWNKVLLSVDMKPLTGFMFFETGGSFFVDEEQEVAVVLDKARDGKPYPTRNVACIIGKDGYFEQKDLGGGVDPSLTIPRKSLNKWLSEQADRRSLVCSYVSSVQIF